MSKHLQSKYVHEAELAFERAIAGDNARPAIKSLELIGRASIEGELYISDQLVMKLTTHAELVGRAAMLIGMHAEMDGARVLTEMLYARSGYQALVDKGLWQDHPGDLTHQEESDEELVEAVAEHGLHESDLPAGIPESHVWWPLKFNKNR